MGLAPHPLHLPHLVTVLDPPRPPRPEHHHLPHGVPHADQHQHLYTCLGVQELLLVFKDDPENKLLIKMFVKSLNIFTCFIRITISIPIFLKQFSSHLPTKCHMMGRSLLSFSFSNILAWAVRGPGWGEQYFYTYWWCFHHSL